MIINDPLGSLLELSVKTKFLCPSSQLHSSGRKLLLKKKAVRTLQNEMAYPIEFCDMLTLWIIKIQ